MSLRFSISKPLHDLVNEFEGIFLAFLSKMQIDHGGLEPGVTHVSLDDAQIHPGFQQMGGIRVAKRMDGDALFADAGIPFGVAKGALDTAPRLMPAGTSFGHGGWGIFSAFAVSAQRREEQTRVAMRRPIASKQIQGGVR